MPPIRHPAGPDGRRRSGWLHRHGRDTAILAIAAIAVLAADLAIACHLQRLDREAGMEETAGGADRPAVP